MHHSKADEQTNADFKRLECTGQMRAGIPKGRGRATEGRRRTYRKEGEGVRMEEE